MGKLEDARFTEGRTEDLEADRKILRSLAAGDGKAGHSGKGTCNGVDVGEVHLERVVRLFAQFEGRDGRRRRDDAVNFCEGLAEVLGDERAYFLAFQIIGVVIASGKDVSAEDDAAFHLWTEPRATRFAVHADERRVVCAEAVTNAIIP